jgi:hypothetical protein
VEWATPLMVLAREDGPIDAEVCAPVCAYCYAQCRVMILVLTVAEQISDLSCGDYALRCRAFNGYGEGPFSTVVRLTLGAAQRCCLPLNSSEQLSGEGSEQLPSTQGEELFLARIGPATILALWQTPALADSDIIALQACITAHPSRNRSCGVPVLNTSVVAPQLQRLDLGSSDSVRDDAIGWEDADVVRIDRLVPDLCCQVRHETRQPSSRTDRPNSGHSDVACCTCTMAARASARVFYGCAIHRLMRFRRSGLGPFAAVPSARLESMPSARRR